MKRNFAVPILLITALLGLASMQELDVYGSSLQSEKSGGSEETGDFQVEGGRYGEDYSYEDGILTILQETQLTVSGSVRGGGIITAENISAELVLDGMTINADGCALDIQGDGLTLRLEGKNTLTSGAGCPGIRVPDGAVLQIEGDTDASLSVRGGTESAGIGASKADDFGRIVISGGTVSTAGGRSGAGIGSGSEGGTGSIEIMGGHVTARGGAGAADMGNHHQDAIVLNGNAVLEADEIIGETEWQRGVLLQGNRIDVYGNVELEQRLPLSTGKRLTILEGARLTIPQELTLNNLGQIAVYGILDVRGELDNTKGRIYLYESGSILREENIAGEGAVLVEEGGILLSQGDVFIQEEGYRQNGVLTELAEESYILHGGENKECTVTVADGVSAVIELDGVAISSPDGEAALVVGENADVTLVLSGENSLTAGQYEEAVQIEEGASLTIIGTGILSLRGREGRESLTLTGGDGAESGTPTENREAQEESTDDVGTGSGVYEITLESGESLAEGQINSREGSLYTVSLEAGSRNAREMTLPRSVLRKIIGNEASFRLETDYLAFEMDAEALKALQSATKGDVRIRISPFSLSGTEFEDARTLIGNGPVYDIQISEDVGGTVTARNVEFGSGKVKLEIPYSRTGAEEIGMVYVGTANRVTWIEDTEYQTDTGTAEAFVPHFSVYGVAIVPEENSAEGWRKEADGNFYYYYSDGSKATNTVIDGYRLDGTGRRIGNAQE